MGQEDAQFIALLDSTTLPWRDCVAVAFEQSGKAEGAKRPMVDGQTDAIKFCLALARPQFRITLEAEGSCQRPQTPAAHLNLPCGSAPTNACHVPALWQIGILGVLVGKRPSQNPY